LLFIIITFLLSLPMIENFLINFFITLSKVFLSFFHEASWEIINNKVYINSIPFIIVKECTGISMYALITSFALAYNPSKKNLKYLAIAVLLLVALNTLRIITLFTAGFYFQEYITTLHNLLWPSTFFFFTLLTGYYYIKISK